MYQPGTLGTNLVESTSSSTITANTMGVIDKTWGVRWAGGLINQATTHLCRERMEVISSRPLSYSKTTRVVLKLVGLGETQTPWDRPYNVVLSYLVQGHPPSSANEMILNMSIVAISAPGGSLTAKW